jgi:hypothetical protein
MVSSQRDAELPANHLPISPAPRIITPLEFDQHPIPNEEAVASDSSLSQNVSHSVRSTPASSFSNHRSSRNIEGQSSGLQRVEEIELSPCPSRGNSSNSFGNNTLQPIPAGISQHHNPTTLTRGQGVSSDTPQPLNQQRLYARSFQESLHAMHRYLPTYEITSNTIALLALSLTTFFGYKTYRITLEGVEFQHYQICIEEKVW